MRHHRTTALVALAAISAMSFTTASAAIADTGSGSDQADDIAAVVTEAAPFMNGGIELETSPTEATATLDGGGEAILAMDPARGVRITSADDTDSMSFSLPGASGLDDAAVAGDGSLNYVGDATTPSINLMTGAESIRVSVVIDNAAQADRFDYDFGPDATVEIQDDGSAIAYVVESTTDPATGGAAATEKIIANIDAPWAKDANGVEIPTYYEASGSQLTQFVDHQDGDYAYPIVADPTLDRPNVFQYRLRFNRAETATIASGGAGIIASVGCGVMAPVCVVAGGSVWWNASVAQNSNPKRCVQVTATQPYIYPGVLWWVDTYSGGPCR